MVFVHTIVWYLYVSTISERLGKTSFKDGRRLLFQDAGLAKQVFSTITGNNVSLSFTLTSESSDHNGHSKMTLELTDTFYLQANGVIFGCVRCWINHISSTV